METETQMAISSLELSNLTSGFLGALIGSIIGAIATYKAAIKSTLASIEGSIKADSKRRSYETNELKRQIINYLISEIKDNLQLSKKAKISYAKIRFFNEAYEMAKTHAQILPSGILKLLRPAYVEIARYNVLADYDQEKHGHGYLDNALAKQAKEVKNSLSGLEEKLEKHLKGNKNQK